MSFDGFNDYVDIGSLPQLENADELTVSCWIFKDKNYTHEGFVGKWDTSHRTDNSFLLYNSEQTRADNASFCVFFTDDTYDFVHGKEKVPTGIWIHIVGVWKGSTGKLSLYKNGALENYSYIEPNKILKYVTNYKAKIGQWGHDRLTDSKYYMSGKIDEVRIYNRALSNSEIKYLYDGKSIGNDDVTNNATKSNRSPGFSTTATIVIIGTTGALVAFFRRRHRIR